MKNFIIILLVLGIISCKNSEKSEMPTNSKGSELKIENAKGFSITTYDDYSILQVTTPWPDAKETFTYLLAKKNATLPDDLEYDQKVIIPVEKIVVTSTTHIPALEALQLENKLVGFPGLHYISSERTRDLIKRGKITELGQNESINTEVLINLSPDLVIGFAINAANKSFETIQKTGIPVIYNGDWTETTPLGKAEWIKFFGALFDKNEEATEIFNTIKSEYIAAKKLAESSNHKPSVIAGSMFKDKWYMPYGNSWQAQFMKDAQANYLYSDTNGDGSIALSFESVLDKAKDAEFWVSSGQFTSYDELLENSPHYSMFKAVEDRKVYSVSLAKGETGGIIFYELGPQRPDLILKDLISIFHPDLLQSHEPVFYQPLR